MARISLVLYTLCPRTNLIPSRDKQVIAAHAPQIYMVWDELKRNNIDIDKETLSFHNINTYVREHEEIYETVISL